jgi:hypothetical protein
MSPAAHGYVLSKLIKLHISKQQQQQHISCVLHSSCQACSRTQALFLCHIAKSMGSFVIIGVDNVHIALISLDQSAA